MVQSPILSFALDKDTLWAAGPGGLLAVDGDGAERIVPQPMRNLSCCLAYGERVLVGGTPYGVAYHPRSQDLAAGVAGAEEGWQAAYMDHVSAPVMCAVADPAEPESGQLLAGCHGGGILRSADGGKSWQTSNFGLHDPVILALAWTPEPPARVWPRWSVVFACAEGGIYRSPNGGRGWKRADCPPAVYQCIAPALDFHRSRLVLAGSEEAGLFRSTDGGRSFQPVAGSPTQVNSVLCVPGGWVLSGGEQLWRSQDGETWQPIPDSSGALVLFHHDNRLFVGTEGGILSMETPSWT
jgi:hypothetical protein